jgi:hypothetical protein
VNTIVAVKTRIVNRWGATVVLSTSTPVRLLAFAAPTALSPAQKLFRRGLFTLSVAVCVMLTACHKEEPYVVEDLLFHLAGEADSPIRFNEKLGEFALVYETTDDGKRVQRTVPLRFSPFTGAPVPWRGSELFMAPDAGEVEELREKLKDAQSFTDVERVFGHPDSILIGRDQRAQHVYTNIAATFNVVIREYADGSFGFTYYGKRKPQ